MEKWAGLGLGATVGGCGLWEAKIPFLEISFQNKVVRIPPGGDAGPL